MMKACVLTLLSLLLSLATVCAVAPAVRAAKGGVLDFTVLDFTEGTPHAPTSVKVAVMSAEPPASSSTVPAAATPTASHSPALSFDLPLAVNVTAPQSAVPSVVNSEGVDQAALFTGGSNSLVARVVGHAEGTRTSDGGKTRAYYGHVDPGNGVWNLGSFSYQHGAKSPAAADEQQLQRLQAQAETIRQKAAAHRFNLSLSEALNAIDLANQSPLAALDTPGYVEWLERAHAQGLTGEDAVLWARTQSYWNPQQKRWEAPGLGNTAGSISHDQKRRQMAIAESLAVYEQQALARRKADEPSVKVADKPPLDRVVDHIIFQDLSQSPLEAAQ